jgi:dsRNA-specific ribonuclease
MQETVVVDRNKYDAHCHISNVVDTTTQAVCDHFQGQNVPTAVLQGKYVSRRLLYMKQRNTSKRDKPHHATYLDASACHALPVSVALYHSMRLIPTLTAWTDVALLAHEVTDKLHLPIRLNYLMEALLTPSFNYYLDYERLETYGDAVLKFITSTYVYVMYPNYHEGQMHGRRKKMLSNKALCRLARTLDLPHFITSLSFRKKQWRPYGCLYDFEASVVQEQTHRLADKQLADVVEAILGASCLHQPVEQALHAMLALGVPMPDVSQWSDFVTHTLPCLQQLPDYVLQHLKLSRVESILGYTFTNKAYLLEALTHSTAFSSLTACYQRLEFLGDAVLEYLLIDYIVQRYPTSPPGTLTAVKSACASNGTLAAIACELGLHKALVHNAEALVKLFASYAASLEAVDERKGQFWFDVNEPKVLADMLEALFGAVFVDSNYNVASVVGMFDRLMRTFLDTYIDLDTLRHKSEDVLFRGLQRLGCTQAKIWSEVDGVVHVGRLTVHEQHIVQVQAVGGKEARKKVCEEYFKLHRIDHLATLCTC